MFALILFGLELAEVGLIALALAFAAEVLGVSRSSRTIRVQNADLRERNVTLEKRVHILEGRERELSHEVSAMKEKNVDALYEVLVSHERSAAERHQASLTVLNRIVGRLGPPLRGEGGR